MVPLAVLTNVQRQLDKLTVAMHQLTVRAVPVYKQSQFQATSKDQVLGTFGRAPQQAQQQPSEPASDSEGYDDEPCTIKWQLYYYDAKARA